MITQDGEVTANELASKHGEDKVAFMYVDVSSHTNFEAAFLRCIELFSGVDIIVNNAGMNGDASWESMININLKVCSSETILHSTYLVCS